jgi:hypothetical protein
MSMDRKRFGAGIVGGLLLGLLLVGTTAFSSGLSGTFGAALPQTVALQSSSSTVASTSTMVSTSVSTSGSIAYTASPGGNSATTFTSSSLSVSSVSSSVQTSGEYTNVISNGTPKSSAAQLSASRLDNIVSQPLILNGLVLAPLIVALALGALLYRVSSAKGRSEEKAAAV